MDQLPEFVFHHPFLWAALGVVVIAFIANEAWRHFAGSAPIPSAEAIRLINNEDAVVVDTRSANDYKKSHIVNAKHIPATSVVERAKEISRDPDKPVILYCGTGHSAQQAATKLRGHGFNRVFALKGGINAWQADGMPLTSK
jgi:rhodanese-related sulfurtransferase